MRRWCPCRLRSRRWVPPVRCQIRAGAVDRACAGRGWRTGPRTTLRPSSACVGDVNGQAPCPPGVSTNWRQGAHGLATLDAPISGHLPGRRSCTVAAMASKDAGVAAGRFDQGLAALMAPRGFGAQDHRQRWLILTDLCRVIALELQGKDDCRCGQRQICLSRTSGSGPRSPCRAALNSMVRFSPVSVGTMLANAAAGHALNGAISPCHPSSRLASSCSPRDALSTLRQAG